ncbi:acyl-CoA dehydrogenase [Hydrocarboniphaga effusa]|uniref:acyl-CoA dehydrogenase n=1 Tax=Hydrocarboniphaga effusa TaxID=243629 RepID=UPI0031378252
MSFVIAVVAVIAVAWVLAFVGAPLWLWTVLSALAYAAGVATGSLGAIGAGVLGVPLAVLALLNSVPLRRAIVTRPIFGAFKKVLPEMSSTEREALEAGDVWLEAEMFRGRPDWSQLLTFNYTKLTDAEQSFLDNECEELCKLVDDWKVEFEDKDLPPAAWAYIKEKGFFSMLIKKEYGGLGFSAAAQSAVVTKLATRNISLAVTVMVPNSLGPGELLMHYGTDEQKKKWLPGLISGEEIPCFGLTGPEVGSDATAMPDSGVVCYGEHEGQRVLGIKLNFSKRYITLAPVATVVGLAFNLKDPQGLLGKLLNGDGTKSDYGITCALVPAKHEGIQIGRRHFPGAAFMNGPIFGRDVFIPIDWVIGGPAMAGKGWRMLVECLSAGRGISLPALATAGGQAAFRMTGAYSRVRRQFKMAIGKFEGVQEATGRIAGNAYTLEAMRVLTASAVDHCAPSVVTAIAKYHMTELLRRSVTDAMDVLSGRGIQQGPRNPIATAYKVVPVAITVEGANILTRNLMIFGQGAIRCHEYVFPEMEAARENDLAAFDKLLFGHVGFSINRGVRALTLGLTGSALARSPMSGPMAPYFKQLERFSAALAFSSDVTMGVLGGELKRKERLSARLGDVLSQLYIGCAVIKFFIENGQKAEELDHARWALDNCLYEIAKAFEGFFDNFPARPIAAVLRLAVFPLGNQYKPVSDRLNQKLADAMMEPSDLRDRMSHLVFRNGGEGDAVVKLERAFELLQTAEAPYAKFFKALSKGEFAGGDTASRLQEAVARGLLNPQEAARVAEYDALRYEVILTDDFAPEYIQGDFSQGDSGIGVTEAERAKVLEFTGGRNRVG